MLGHRLNTHSADSCSFAGECAPPVSRVCFGGYWISYRRPPRRLEAILSPLARNPRLSSFRISGWIDTRGSAYHQCARVCLIAIYPPVSGPARLTRLPKTSKN